MFGLAVPEGRVTAAGQLKQGTGQSSVHTETREEAGGEADLATRTQGHTPRPEGLHLLNVLEPSQTRPSHSKLHRGKFTRVGDIVYLKCCVNLTELS